MKTQYMIIILLLGVCSAEVNKTCETSKPCSKGVVLPVWLPLENLSTTQIVFRSVIYFSALCFMFLGVSIVAERFMASIEVITSQEREVKLRKVTGEPYTILIRLWNETVSNLTLMALGSSAPEILLSVIEIIGNDFKAGDLGPGTIVGSAAFNLFIIVAVCIYTIPNNEKRKIKNRRVFWVTIVWSTFAYIWLYLIISVFSPGVIEVWEGVLTFLCFPLTVLSAYFADRYIKLFGKRFISGRAAFIRRSSRKQYAKATQGSSEASERESLQPSPFENEIIAYQEQRKTYLELFRKLRSENPDLAIQDLEKLALERAVQQKPKSRAFYKIQTLRNLTGNRKTASSETMLKTFGKIDQSEQHEKVKQAVVRFDPDSYICMEGVGSLNIHVRCDRGALESSCTVLCDYKTVAGTAHEYEDFIPTHGVLTFKPDQTWSHLFIKP